MARVTFSYEGINIRAILERDADIQWLREFLLPWFGISDDAPDIEVRVNHDPLHFQQLLANGPTGGSVNAFMMDTRIVDFPRWNVSAGQQLFFDEKLSLFYLLADKQIRLVVRDSGNAVRKCVMRVLRELAMGISQLRGGRFLHASAFEWAGRAAIITGPREAGKTSLLCYLLANSGGQFLTNDRLLIRQCGPSFRLKGMPTIVSIREGTMGLFPGMRKSIVDQCFTTQATMAETRQMSGLTLFQAKTGRHGLSPRQFCALLDCEPVQAASAALLLFPRQTGRPGGLRLVRLGAQEARQRLANCLFGYIGPDRLSEAFTIMPAGMGGQPAPDDDALRQGLANSLPAYDCELGNDTYNCDLGATRLLQLLERADKTAATRPMNTA